MVVGEIGRRSRRLRGLRKLPRLGEVAGLPAHGRAHDPRPGRSSWSRHRGSIARALIARARNAGVHVMVAAIDGDNADSIAFHERLGFRRRREDAGGRPQVRPVARPGAHAADPLRSESEGTPMRFVLVHGGFHGAWCWSRTIPELQAPRARSDRDRRSGPRRTRARNRDVGRATRGRDLGARRRRRPRRALGRRPRDHPCGRCCAGARQPSGLSRGRVAVGRVGSCRRHSSTATTA